VRKHNQTKQNQGTQKEPTLTPKIHNTAWNSSDNLPS